MTSSSRWRRSRSRSPEPIEYRRGDEVRLTTPGRVIFECEIERALEASVRGELGEPVVVDSALTKRELDA